MLSNFVVKTVFSVKNSKTPHLAPLHMYLLLPHLMDKKLMYQVTIYWN